MPLWILLLGFVGSTVIGACAFHICRYAGFLQLADHIRALVTCEIGASNLTQLFPGCFISLQWEQWTTDAWSFEQDVLG